MQSDGGGEEQKAANSGSSPPAGAEAGNSRSTATSSTALTTQELQGAFLLGQEHGGELTQDLLQAQGWPKEKIVAVFNRLTEARAGVIRRTGNAADICCALRPANIIAKLKTLDNFDYKVYCAIEQAGSTGVWTADLRKSTGLQTHVIQRSVKQLCEMLKLIKPVKSIHVKNRKMYILSHLEPSKEIAGGSFYSNGEFNEPVVDHLREQACTFLQSAGTASFQALAAYTRSSGELSGATFSDEDLENVLSSLEYEQKITKIITPQQVVYMWSRFPDLYDGTALPCSRCHLKHLCCRGADNPISPANCEYYSYWLGLDFEIEGGGAMEEVAQVNGGQEED